MNLLKSIDYVFRRKNYNILYGVLNNRRSNNGCDRKKDNQSFDETFVYIIIMVDAIHMVSNHFKIVILSIVISDNIWNNIFKIKQRKNRLHNCFSFFLIT